MNLIQLVKASKGSRRSYLLLLLEVDQIVGVYLHLAVVVLHSDTLLGQLELPLVLEGFPGARLELIATSLNIHCFDLLVH